MNGSQACDTKNALKGVDAIGTPTSHKWKRLPRFRSSMASAVNVALDDHKKHRVDNEEHLVTNPPHALAVCSTHASFLVHQEARDKECVCLLCERPMTSITQEERPPHMALTPSAAWVAQPRSVLGVTVAEQQWIQQELNNLASRVPGLSHRVAHELYVEQLDVIHPRCISLCSTADVSSSPSSSPSCTAPSYATAAGGVSMAPPTPTLTSFACIHAWTFPAHGWLLRALDEASDPRIRQATLDLLVRVFTSHMHHPAVPELRFKIHLPLLQSIFDLDPHVLESAVECIVVASHLAPLKDGAAHKLVAFFTSCTQQQWSFSLFRLLERCCYYDASALKVLVKGLMNVLFKNTAHNDMFLLCFSQFFFAVDVSLSLETNSERHFFSFWHPSIEVPPNCTLDDHNLWLLVFLRSCYRIGRRHFSHISSVYDSQSITSLDISTYDDYKLRGYKANVPLPLQGLEALGLLCLMLGAGLKYCIQPQLSAPHCFKDSLFIFLQGPPTTLLSSEYQWVHWCYMGNPPGCSF